MQQHLTIEQASVRANRCARTIAKALADGELKGRRRGPRVFISARELDAWAESKGIVGGAIPVTAAEMLELAQQLVRVARQQRAGRKDAA